MWPLFISEPGAFSLSIISFLAFGLFLLSVKLCFVPELGSDTHTVDGAKGILGMISCPVCDKLTSAVFYYLPAV
jgi:hypothetical protein